MIAAVVKTSIGARWESTARVRIDKQIIFVTTIFRPQVQTMYMHIFFCFALFAVCSNVTYLRADYGISVTITYNTYVIFNETMSGNELHSCRDRSFLSDCCKLYLFAFVINFAAKNPPPFCIGIPELEKIHAAACVRLYNLTWGGKHFRGCAKASISVYHMIHKSMELGCWDIPEGGLAVAYINHSSRILEMIKEELEELAYFKKDAPGVNMI